MDSNNLQILYDSLKEVVVNSIIKSIGRFHIVVYKKSPLYIEMKNPELKLVKIKKLTSTNIIFDDNISIEYNSVNNIKDLIRILDFIDNWKQLKAKDSFAIEWSLVDFEQVANDIEEESNLSELYDRKKFSLALKILEDRYDCNNGITWVDIENHLNEFCRIQ